MSDGARSVLEVRDVHTYYGESHVLHGVSLTVAPGQVVTILGRNGMGKTTLIRSVIGFTPARRGVIRFKGHDVTRWPPFRTVDLGMGLVPQGRRVFPSLSVRENLEVGARPGYWTQQRVFELFPNLGTRLSNMGSQLSGGEQQMLSIARALLTNPSVLLMDEPTEGLAPVVVEALTAVLLRLRGEGALSIVLVEQNSRVALAFSARTVVMDKGRIVYDGASAPLSADPERLAKLIGVE